MKISAWVFGLFTAALLGAAPPDHALQWVHRGDDAYERGEYAAAVHFYERAETETTDPGLVSFNKAAALYRLGRYLEAAQAYRCSQEDATGARRARVHYDLGNCLAQQAGERDAVLLERAVRSYEACLRDPAADAELRAMANTNLRIVHALWKQAQAAKAEPERGGQDHPRADRPGHHDSAQRPQENRHDRTDGQPDDEGAIADQNTSGAVPTDRLPPPGAGNLPPVPDDDQLVPLSAEATAAYLRQAAARIERTRWEARQRHRHAALPVAGIKDW